MKNNALKSCNVTLVIYTHHVKCTGPITICVNLMHRQIRKPLITAEKNLGFGDGRAEKNIEVSV